MVNPFGSRVARPKSGPELVFEVATHPEIARNVKIGSAARAIKDPGIMISILNVGIAVVEIDAAESHQHFAVRMEIMVVMPLINDPAFAGVLPQP